MPPSVSPAMSIEEAPSQRVGGVGEGGGVGRGSSNRTSLIGHLADLTRARNLVQKYSRRPATTKLPSRKSVLRKRLKEITVVVLHEDPSRARESCTMTLRELYNHILGAITTISPGSVYVADSSGGGGATANGGDTPPPSMTFGEHTATDPTSRLSSVQFAHDDGGNLEEALPTKFCLDRGGGSRPSSRIPRTSAPFSRRERLGGYLHPRDMRKLVTPFSTSNQPEVIVRRHVVLLNFDPVRAIVLRDRLLLLVPNGCGKRGDFIRTLEKRLRGGVAELENEVFGEREDTSLEGKNEDGSACKSSGNKVYDLFAGVNRRGSPFGKTFSSLRKRLSSDNLAKQEDATATTGNDTDDDEADEDDEFHEIQNRKFIDMTFELLAVDVVLETAVKLLVEDASQLYDRVHKTIAIVRGEDKNQSANQRTQEKLRDFKDDLGEMKKHIKGFENALTRVLTQDEDMALMNLSRIITHPERFVLPVSQEVLAEESDEPELILEAYLQQALSASNELDLLGGQVATTEELNAMKLDTVRNRLLLINTVLSLFAVVIGAGSFIGSIFGMNLASGLEYDPDAFKQVVIGTLVGSFGLFVALAVMFLQATTGL